MFKFSKMVVLFSVIFLFLSACQEKTSSQPENVRDEIWSSVNIATNSILSYYEDDQELNKEQLQQLSQIYKKYDNGMSPEITDEEALLLISVSKISPLIIMHSENKGELLLTNIDEDIEYIKEILDR